MADTAARSAAYIRNQGLIRPLGKSPHSPSEQIGTASVLLRFAFALSELFSGLVDQALAVFRSLPAKEFQPLVFKLVGGDEKFLDLLADRFRQLARIPVRVFA